MNRINYLIEELPGDIETPISALLKLRQLSPIFLLESSAKVEELGRYSFIGLYPWLTIKSTQKILSIQIEENEDEYVTSNPIPIIEETLNNFYSQADLPYLGGPTGYFSYDFVRYIEEIPDEKKDPFNLPYIFLRAPSVFLVFDHLYHSLKIIGVIPPSGNHREVKKKMEKVKNFLGNIQISETTFSGYTTGIKSNFSKEKFIEAVQKAKQYIIDGEIFQVVLSQRLEAETSLDHIEIYRRLRRINPSPYLFLLNFKGFQLIGSSPEVHVKKVGEKAMIRPIAGTRPRGSNPIEDKELEKDLLSDPKERAEHVMLVDLARNDLGRVSRAGSVYLSDPYRVEYYSHVMHIVTDVVSTLKSGITPLMLLSSTFPAGTVSGAPKVRAMEIIEELEPQKRGPYAGAVGYIDFNGNMDTCITIRTILKIGEKVYLQAGAGIVYDSIPEKEYEETINKARALLTAVKEDKNDLNH